MSHQINITSDYREVPSKTPDILEDIGADVKRKQLKTSDYIINNEIIVERKFKEDLFYL
jgi:DNA excision repair protein ERCC-4